MNLEKVMTSKLTPLPEDAFDGDHQSLNIPKDLPRCPHKNVKFVNGELRCPCGSAWQGPGIHDLYKAFTA